MSVSKSIFKLILSKTTRIYVRKPCIIGYGGGYVFFSAMFSFISKTKQEFFPLLDKVSNTCGEIKLFSALSAEHLNCPPGIQ